MKIFLDANVLFSAGKVESDLRLLLNLLRDEGHSLITSHYAYDEAERNISAKRPQWLDSFYHFTAGMHMADGYKLDTAISLDEKDRPILASAILEKCDYLLTGDRQDFGHLYNQTISGVTVVNYVTLMTLLKTRNSGL